jgi:hypothetical protein
MPASRLPNTCVGAVILHNHQDHECMSTEYVIMRLRLSDLGVAGPPCSDRVELRLLAPFSSMVGLRWSAPAAAPSASSAHITEITSEDSTTYAYHAFLASHAFSASRSTVTVCDWTPLYDIGGQIKSSDSWTTNCLK